MTFDVTGVLGENEKLTGAMTRYGDGGTIELFGGPRTHCLGSFHYFHKDRMVAGGEGMLMCDDRRVGPFRFVLKGVKHGSGSGTLSGQPYSFSF